MNEAESDLYGSQAEIQFLNYFNLLKASDSASICGVSFLTLTDYSLILIYYERRVNFMSNDVLKKLKLSS